jgi:spore germination protein YaaH
MKRAYELLIENKAAIEWKEDVAQYYGEYVMNEATHKIWLEEEKSIERKLQLLEKYDLAGVSGWKLGLEKDEVWPLIRSYLKE